MIYLGIGLVSLPLKLFTIWYTKPKRMDEYEMKTLERKIESSSLSLIKQAKVLKDKKFEIDFNSTFLTKRFKTLAFGRKLGAFQ